MEAEFGPNLKVIRRQRKAALTRRLGGLRRAVAEDDSELVRRKLQELKSAFGELEDAHEAYHNSLMEDSEVQMSEVWFDEAENDYVEGIKSARAFLRDGHSDSNDSASAPAEGAGTHIRNSDLTYLPKVEIECFDGNPTNFQSFFAIFDELVDKLVCGSQIKLTRLLQYTSGAARAAIRNCALIGGDEGYRQAREILVNRFGNPHLVSQKVIKELKYGKTVSRAVDLQQLADELRMARAVLESIGMLSELENQQSILDILHRCKPFIANRWRRTALDYKRMHFRYPPFGRFVEFMVEVASEACDPVYGGDGDKGSKISCVNALVSETVTVDRPYGKSPVPECVVCGALHRLFYCDAFKQMSPTTRLDLVKKHRLCFNCLLPGHSAGKCHKPSVCSVAGCGRKHTKFIHVDPASFRTTDNVRPPRDDRVTNYHPAGFRTTDNVRPPRDDRVTNYHPAGFRTTDNVRPPRDDRVTNYHPAGFRTTDNVRPPRDRVTNYPTEYVANVSSISTNVLMPIVPVLVNNGQEVFALLDTGSTSTFITERLTSRLGLDRTQIACRVNTLNGSNDTIASVVSLNISPLGGETALHPLKGVLVVPQIPARLPCSSDRIRSPLISSVPIKLMSSQAEVDLLIGVDHAHLLMPLEVRTDPREDCELYATKTRLGWTLCGPMTGDSAREVMCHHVSLEGQIENLWKCEGNDEDIRGLSYEDEQVLSFWDKELRHIDGHYQLPIPWRDGGPSFPNNRFVAERRLQSLTDRLKRSELSPRYAENVDKMVLDGYAEPVPEDQLNLVDSSVWYLPHHAVISDSKPGKLRIVYDCAASLKGVSLNNQCMSGPDLNNKLIDVLLRFRRYPWAITDDIEGMYNQVRVPVEDRNSLRFLWSLGGIVKEFRMTSHLFGGVWCASSSAYALRRTVLDTEVSPLVRDVITQNFYVDDLLCSVKTKREATEILHRDDTLPLFKGIPIFSTPA